MPSLTFANEGVLCADSFSRAHLPHFNFDPLNDLNAAFAHEGTGAIRADVANYTTINPVTQIDEILVSQRTDAPRRTYDCDEEA